MTEQISGLAQSKSPLGSPAGPGRAGRSFAGNPGRPAEITLIRGGEERSLLPAAPATAHSWDANLLAYTETQGRLDDLYLNGFLERDIYERATTRWLVLNGLPVTLCESCRIRRGTLPSKFPDTYFWVCGECFSKERS